MDLLRRRALAHVGTLLCLYPREHRGELDAWRSAQVVCAETCIDDDGVRESLRFMDAGGRSCLRLFLLPDSDYAAWEQLRAGLSCVAMEVRRKACGPCDALRRCMGGWFGGPGWQASFLRLQASDPAAGGWALERADVSGIGREIARRIARAEGVALPAAA